MVTDSPLVPDETEKTALPEAAAATRRCLVTGVDKNKTEMIRFVVGPEQILVPDLAGALPGRGLWVSADKAALDQAIRKNMFARAAKENVKIPEGLLETVLRLLERRCLDLLGLARGAGLVVTGQGQVEEALKAGRATFVLVATDAGTDGLKKLGFSTVPVLRGLTRAALGAALGRDHSVYIAFKPHALTTKFKNELLRWQGVENAASMASSLDSEKHDG